MGLQRTLHHEACDLHHTERMSLVSCSAPGALRSTMCRQAVVHASGVLADASLRKQDAAGVRGVMAPKGRAAEALTPKLVAHPMALHVMFSSLAALLPSAGQANYAAANAELDAAASMCGLCHCTRSSVDKIVLPHLRRDFHWASTTALPVITTSWRFCSGSCDFRACRYVRCTLYPIIRDPQTDMHLPRLHHTGVPAFSIQWGPWAGAGMATKTFAQASAAWRTGSLLARDIRL